MSRNGSGTYSVPNTFAPGDTISSADHNENFDDLGDEITNSLALDGQSTMTGQLKSASGTAAAPGITFGSDLDTGFARTGANELTVAAGGAAVALYTTATAHFYGALVASGTASFGAIGTANFVASASFGSSISVSATATFASGFIASATCTFAGVILASATATFTTGISAATVAGSMVATQAQMEAAASANIVVTPARAKYHPGVAKAWGYVTFPGGTPTLSAGHNVTSLTDNGTGDTTINLTTAFSSGNFAAVVTALDTSGASSDLGEMIVAAITASTIRVQSFKATSTTQTTRNAADRTFFFVAFGDQ